MSKTVEIVIPYKPRPQFVPFHARKERFGCVVAHRRFGKTVGCLNDLQRGALTCERESPRFAYIAPYLSQAKAVAWDYLLKYSNPIPQAVANHSELRVDYPNGGRVRLFGADNADAMRGIYLDGVVFDEPAQMDPRVWPQIIRPALADRQGWAVFIGTPAGHNAFYDIREMARNSPDWFYLELRASQTDILLQSELDMAKHDMTEDQYEQEFECSFEAAIIGAYYGKLMREAEEDERIGRVPYDPILPVHTAWDLGIGDSTAIWFAQVTGMECRLIDYYESSGVGLDHYASVLKSKPYAYAEHLLPHDVMVSDLSTGRTRFQTLASLGINARVLNRDSIDDGINSVRNLIPKCWFDAKKCVRGIEGLKQYRAEFDDKLKTFKNRPLHDWTSHCFTGNTEVLTRHGTYQIMNLPKSGEVLTSCGWKQYQNVRVTRKDASLVEVRFSDGLTVKCTPDHLFKTVNGWKSAESLLLNTEIQSGWTSLRNTSMADSTGFGRLKITSREAVGSFIERFGVWLSGIFLKDAISTIEMMTPRTIGLKISNVWPLLSTCPILGTITKKSIGIVEYPAWHAKKLLNGIDQKRGACGILAMQSVERVGQSGSGKSEIARFVMSCFNASLEKLAELRSTAPTIARPLHIVGVAQLSETSDVYCMSVPEAEEFSLANGALVHNCADAFRYLARGLPELSTTRERQRYSGRHSGASDSGWMTV